MGFLKSELHVPIFVTSMIVILMGHFCAAETDPVDGIVYKLLILCFFQIFDDLCFKNCRDTNCGRRCVT